MTAAVVSWGGDALPDGVHIGPAAESTLFFTKAKARQVTDEIRHHLGAGILGLQLAREGHAHLALGYATWHDYCLAEFGDLKELRLPTAERRALVASMCDAGLSVRDIRKAIGFSVGTIQADRVALGYTRSAGDVTVLPEPEVDPYAGMTHVQQATARVAEQGDRGLTCREVELDTGWHHGTASAALSKANRRGLVRQDGRARQGYGVYVITDLGREVLAAL